MWEPLLLLIQDDAKLEVGHQRVEVEFHRVASTVLSESRFVRSMDSTC